MELNIVSMLTGAGIAILGMAVQAWIDRMK